MNPRTYIKVIGNGYMHNGWIQDLKGQGEHGVLGEGGLFMINKNFAGSSP